MTIIYDHGIWDIISPAPFLHLLSANWTTLYTVGMLYMLLSWGLVDYDLPNVRNRYVYYLLVRKEASNQLLDSGTLVSFERVFSVSFWMCFYCIFIIISKSLEDSFDTKINRTLHVSKIIAKTTDPVATTHDYRALAYNRYIRWIIDL